MSNKGVQSNVSLPHHVIDHLPYGDLQSSQRLVGWQDVRQPCEAQHTGHCKQYLCNQLGVLLMPVLTHCMKVPCNQSDLSQLDVCLNNLIEFLSPVSVK